MFTDQKQASGWKDRGGGADAYEWVEGGNIPLTAEEKEADHTRLMWIGYCAFHLGDYRKALDTYQQLIQEGSDDQTLLTYKSKNFTSAAIGPTRDTLEGLRAHGV